MNKKLENRVGYSILIVCFIALLFLSEASAEEIYEYNSTLQLKQPCYFNGDFCDNTASCNITVIDPDGETFVTNENMQNQIYENNYTVLYNHSQKLGEYRYNIICAQGTSSNYGSFNYKITGNGREGPEGITIVVFSILFIIIMASLIYLIVLTIGHLIALDFDPIDLAWNFGAFFAFLSILMLEKFYVGNLDIEHFFNLILWLVGFTHIFLPALALVLSMTIGQLRRPKEDG